ncbi:MAG: von Willebrand factor type A domain-containing protein, partial [Candidatus Poribacteria bacterium]|nr:von Willebrand factor type A domain-containing protein [Candidatus Poribacteria bacterium]
MKVQFRTFYQLNVVLMMCGLMLFIYMGCGGSDDEAYEDEAAHGFIPSALNPPNGAVYDDVFFKEYGTNPFIDTEDDHFSTFGMDVDTASYSVTRRYLRDGHLPPPEAVRVEEFVNAFDYNYAPPSKDAFAVHIEGAPSRFGEGKRLQLLRIGIQGRVIPDENRKDAMLTFVIDVSGSMAMENRLELVKRALTLLVEQLRPGDEVAIV